MKNYQSVFNASLTLISILLIFTCSQAEITNAKTSSISSTLGSGKTLMAVFAHPDDESTVAPVLAKYVREGANVHLIITTDGRLGVNDFSGLEAGDGLVAIRKKEMECAAEALGVKLIHLNYHDQLKAGEGYDGHMPHAQALIKEIHQLVSDIKPDVLLTFGPDGASNHLDHRLIGATTTAVYLSQKWKNPSALYFVSTPSSLLDTEESKILRGVDDSYLTTQVTYTDEDFEKAVNSMLCHKSQFQLEGLRERMIDRRKKRGSKIYFRKFVSKAGFSESLFDESH